MDQRQFEAMLADAELRLRRLRTLYDQWFVGIERVEPRNPRADVDRIITELRRSQPRNTALRFRFNQLVQRYTTYNTYWQRIARQIEEGTYKRDVLRARKRLAEAEAEAEAKQSEKKSGADGYDLDLDIDIEAALDAVQKGAPSDKPPPSSSRPPPSSERPPRALREITPFALPGSAESAPIAASAGALPRNASAALAAELAARAVSGQSGSALGQAAASGAAARRAPPIPSGASRNPPPIPASAQRLAAAAQAKAPAPAQAASPGALSDAQIQSIYQRYLDARRQNSERTDNVRIETVAKTVRDMLPKLAQKHAGKQIDFEVVVKDGRVALKPVAR